MKLSFQARVLAAAIGSVVLAGLLVIGGFSAMFHTTMRRAGDWTLPPDEQAACEADPAAWSRRVVDIAVQIPYQPDGRSVVPGEPPLPDDIVAQVREHGYAVSAIDGERVEVKQITDHGPCAWLSLRLRPPRGTREEIGTGMLIVAAGALLAAALGAMTFVVWPVLRRVDALRVSAERVGAVGYAPAADDVGDAISGIGAVLDASHERLTALEADLRARQGALEQHMAEIAHDLRTPLASMLLALQDASAETGAGTVSRALADAESMSALIDNLHQGSRLRRGADVTDGTCDLRDLVGRLGVRFAALARLRGVQVEVAVPDAPVWVRGAPSPVERALANLMHNAVTHGDPGGHAAIVLEATPDRFEVLVIDDGPGMPDDVTFALDAPTFRVDTARSRSTGLGLVITREIADRLGWEIRFEDEQPRGVRVTVVGPVRG